MAKSSTSFNKDTDHQGRKPRGKSERTKILEAMKRAGQSEDDFYDLLTLRAFDPEDSFTFKELLARMSPIPKATSPLVKFDFDENADSHKQGKQILKAMADGSLPADIGNIFLAGLQSMLKIQEVTDLEDRIKVIEEIANNGE